MRRWLLFLFLALLYAYAAKVWAQESRPNRVLSLDGDGDYVEMADSEALNNISSQVTMEAWIRVGKYTTWVPIIYKGGTNPETVSYTLFTGANGSIILGSVSKDLGITYLLTPKVMPGTWMHVAGVIDGKSRTMKIFINGIEVARKYSGEDIHISVFPLRVGSWHGEGEGLSPFAGEIDDVRVWNVARTQGQIRENMNHTLLGTEPGLVGYWRFDDVGSPTARKEGSDLGLPNARLDDSSPSNAHGKLIGDAQLMKAELPDPVVLSGRVIDRSGKPIPKASVRLESAGKEVAQVQTDDSGRYWIPILHPSDDPYDLYATNDELGYVMPDMLLYQGTNREINLTLEKAISIQGKLLMLDETLHVAVPVQVMQEGEVVTGTLSDRSGEYRFINLRPGRYQLRCQVLDGYIYYRSPGEVSRVTSYGVEFAGGTLHVENGRTHENIDFRFPPFKKGTWRNYDTLDGLAHNSVTDICRDDDGVMWFATNAGGVSRYDGKEFTNFTAKDGLAYNEVTSIQKDTHGAIWFSTHGGGVSRYDGNEFTNFRIEGANGLLKSSCCSDDGKMWFGGNRGSLFRYDDNGFVDLTTEYGLAGHIMAIHDGSEGDMWFGTADNGVWLYNGKDLVHFMKADGLAGETVKCIYRDPDGVMWFGTDGGVSRYDGKEFINLTTEHGLAGNSVSSIHRDPDGVMWFGTGGGISRYDGRGFVNFTEADGLASNNVTAIYRSPDGAMWIGTGSWVLGPKGGGVSRYEEGWITDITARDGLVNNHVRVIYHDPDGIVWLGTDGGVSRYDGKKFSNFTIKDGLADNTVNDICCGQDGEMWFATGGGASRYDGSKFSSIGPDQEGVQAVHAGLNGEVWLGQTWSGAYRYDGKKIVKFTTEDGLVNHSIRDFCRDADGFLWFGTWWGASRYDGEEFVNFKAEDGLANDAVLDVYCDPDGILWFGTYDGVSRYDGKEFVSLTTEDGLSQSIVTAIYRDSDGYMWFGTDGGGISAYDGFAWTSLDTRDGLAGNSVSSIYQDTDGLLWFGTNGGITRYRRSASRPEVRITAVAADQTYLDLSEIPALKFGSRITIEYSATDFKTIPEKHQYRYRIQAFGKSLNSDWREPTNSAQFEWTPEEAGAYTFEVQAIDRDLNYSEPVSVEIRVSPPPIYTRAGFIIGAILVAFLVPASAFATVVIRQRRQTFEPIQNPYIVGNPIRTKGMFFGRQSDFEFVQAKLASGQSGQVIVFAGERRSGKTSILFQILNGALGEQFVPVLMDMQAMTVDSEAEFLEKMASGIDEALVTAGYSPYSASINFYEGNPTRAFERFISQIMETLGDRSLLLLLDEYELIELKIEDDILRSDLITFFASLLEAHPRLSFIFTGSRHLQRRSTEYWNILIGKSLYRRISFLSAEDAIRLITEPVTDLVVYPRGIPERIIRLTAGQPFYTQVMCQNMMDRLNEAERNRVRQEDVDAVAAELADNPLPQMIYFWDGLEQEQNGALSLLGEVLEDSNRYASAQMLVNFVQEQKLELELELSDLERVLNDLFVNEMLERERAGEGQYEYRFRVDLFRLWVRQAHSVWETA
ncbi:two-component regulator propeller domain-containing protein [Candidatus Poribacteria bacterium]